MKLILIFLIFVVGVFFFINRIESQNKSSNKTDENLLLPDLKPAVPEQLYINVLENKRIIRFSTTFINQGIGPLELVGKADTKINKVIATQKVKRTNGSFESRKVGEFVLHPSHDHWHIDDYVQFQLWSYKKGGEKDKMLKTTRKLSFCIWDEYSYNLNLQNASQTQYYLNCKNDVQGLSVGWSDTYEADIKGQELDITSVKNGKYLIRTVINPDKRIIENDYSNNDSILYIEIENGTLTILNKP